MSGRLTVVTPIQSHDVLPGYWTQACFQTQNLLTEEVAGTPGRTPQYHGKCALSPFPVLPQRDLHLLPGERIIFRHFKVCWTQGLS